MWRFPTSGAHDDLVAVCGLLLSDSGSVVLAAGTAANGLSVDVTRVTGTVTVTGALTDAQLRAADVKITLDGESVPVTGTFWQATQPISGTVTDGGSGKTLKHAVLSLTATGTVVAAVPTKKIKVYAVKLICSAALSINFRSGASTNLEGIQSIILGGGYVESVNPPNFLFGTTAGESLDLVITGVGTAAGRVSYWDDDAS